MFTFAKAAHPSLTQDNCCIARIQAQREVLEGQTEMFTTLPIRVDYQLTSDVTNNSGLLFIQEGQIDKDVLIDGHSSYMALVPLNLTQHSGLVDGECSLSGDVTELFTRGPLTTIELHARPIRKWKEDRLHDPEISKLEAGMYIAKHTLIKEEESTDLNFHVLINTKQAIVLTVQSRSLIGTMVHI